MADTSDHYPATAARNTTMALSFFVLALAPQIFELLWSLGTLFGIGAGRGPAQVLISHGSALVSAGPGAIMADAKKALSMEVRLALIYTYPLFAIAILTLFVHPKSPENYVGGAVLVAVALLALWASSDLPGMRGFSFGPGTAPRMFGVLLLLLGAAITVNGLLVDGPGLAHYSWRGPLFVVLAIVFFALAIRPLGLVVTGFCSFMIAAVGSPETRWLEAIIVGACLTAGCAVLFPYVLGLPMPMFPRFLIQ